MPAKSPGDVIAAFYHAYNAHDADAASQLYTEEGWHEEVAMGKRKSGSQAVRQGLESLFRMLPDVRWTVNAQVNSADNVVVFYRMSGNLAPADKPARLLTLDGVHLFTLSPAGIDGVRDYWDLAHFKQQMA